MTTKSHVEKEWKDPLRKSWFDKYAYPITDKLWSLWAEDPQDWMPYNHSCDPNSWLDGLDVVARRNIKKGEQITLEYATFCCDNMETFTCLCKSKDCRGTITGTDYLKPFLETYTNHVSDYVETKRKQQKVLNSNVSVNSNGH